MPTYYVSTNGNDANSGTSVSTPLRTLLKALEKADALSSSSEATIILEPGRYAQVKIALTSPPDIIIRGDIFGAVFGKTGFVTIGAIDVETNNDFTIQHIRFEPYNVSIRGMEIGYIGYFFTGPVVYSCLYIGGSSTRPFTVEYCIFDTSSTGGFSILTNNSCPKTLNLRNNLFYGKGARNADNAGGTYIWNYLSGTGLTINVYNNTFYTTVGQPTAGSSKSIILGFYGAGSTVTMDCRNNAFFRFRNCTIYWTPLSTGTTLTLTSNYNYYDRKVTTPQGDLAANGAEYPYIENSKWNMLSACRNGSTRSNFVTIADMRTNGYDANSKHGPGDVWWNNGASSDSGTENGPRLVTGSKLYVQSNSPVAGAGVAGLVTTDIWENTRGNPPDIGAWDFSPIYANRIDAKNLVFTNNRVYMKSPPSTQNTNRVSLFISNTPASLLFAFNILSDYPSLPTAYTDNLFNIVTTARTV